MREKSVEKNVENVLFLLFCDALPSNFFHLLMYTKVTQRLDQI